MSSNSTKTRLGRVFRLQVVSSATHKGQFIIAHLYQAPNKGPCVKLWRPPSTLYNVQLNQITPAGNGQLFLSSSDALALMNEALRKLGKDNLNSSFDINLIISAK